jgi:hypothetical protein
MILFQPFVIFVLGRFTYNIINVSPCHLECDVVNIFLSLEFVCTSYRVGVCFCVVPVPGFNVNNYIALF